MHLVRILDESNNDTMYYISTCQVVKNTGFMKGLYTDSELVSENVKDKDSKVAFLQKAIDMVCKYAQCLTA